MRYNPPRRKKNLIYALFKQNNIDFILTKTFKETEINEFLKYELIIKFLFSIFKD